MSEASEHPLAKLSSEEIRAVASEPLSDRGRQILAEISGKPHANLDDMHADSPDPYGKELQAAFDEDQASDDE